MYSHREREDAGGGVKEIMKDKDSKSKEDGPRQRDLQGPGERGCRLAAKKSIAEAGRNYLMRQRNSPCERRELRVEGRESRDSPPEKRRAQGLGRWAKVGERV